MWMQATFRSTDLVFIRVLKPILAGELTRRVHRLRRRQLLAFSVHCAKPLQAP